MINATSERLKARKVFICRYFSFYEHVENSCSVESSMKKVFITLGTSITKTINYYCDGPIQMIYRFRRVVPKGMYLNTIIILFFFSSFMPN